MVSKLLLEEIKTRWEMELQKYPAHIRGRFFAAAVVNTLNDKIVSIGLNRVLMNSNPTNHAEIVALNNVFKLSSDVRLPEYFVMVSSHEPCMMCASAIMWSGIKNVEYVFSYEETKDLFSVEEDIIMLRNSCGIDHVKNSNLYNAQQIDDQSFKNDLIEMYKKFYSEEDNNHLKEQYNLV